jgi:hypothetical protein
MSKPLGSITEPWELLDELGRHPRLRVRAASSKTGPTSGSSTKTFGSKFRHSARGFVHATTARPVSARAGVNTASISCPAY